MKKPSFYCRFLAFLLFLSVLFAFIGLFATVFCGNMTQINSAVSGVATSFYIRFLIGVLSAILVFLVICGGTSKIADFLSKLLPFMAVIYTFLCFGVILKNLNALPQAFQNIFVGAFLPRAVTGGAIGSILRVVSVGASKGIFSNNNSKKSAKQGASKRTTTLRSKRPPTRFSR